MAVYKLNDNSKSDEHVDIRVDGLMLKVPYKQVATRTKPFFTEEKLTPLQFLGFKRAFKFNSASLRLNFDF